jgi:hypothetical protein
MSAAISKPSAPEAWEIRHQRRRCDHARFIRGDLVTKKLAAALPRAQMRRQIGLDTVRQPVPGARLAAGAMGVKLGLAVVVAAIRTRNPQGLATQPPLHRHRAWRHLHR